MGMFSWKTNDTNKSISNSSSSRGTFTVYLMDNKGNKWKEDNYEGYGVFGGKDYFELLSEMNGCSKRETGINIEHSDNREKYVFPNLVENPNWEWINKQPESCEYQGCFYYNDDNEEYYEDYIGEF